MAKKNDWKHREGVVYSTSPDFDYQKKEQHEAHSLPVHQQNLRIFLDKSGRAGKQVTVVSGFVSTLAEIEKLCKAIKTKCGVGGSVKDGEILIQGDLREKVGQLLSKEGYKVRQQ